MLHISGKSAMSAPIALARRQAASPLRRFASWSLPQAVSCSKAIVSSATSVLLSKNQRGLSAEARSGGARGHAKRAAAGHAGRAPG